MSNDLATEFMPTRGQIIVPIVAGAVFALAALVPKVLALIFVIAFLGTWIWLVDRDYVLALTVFMALMPLWMFLKWVELPAVVIDGSTLHLATILKEVFMLVFFGHWFLSAVRSDEAVVRITPALLGFFAVVVVTLLQGGLSRYPMLLRPYIETFLLVGVPLLSIELTREDIERMLIGTALGGGIAAVIALYHALVDPQFLLWPELIREEIYGIHGAQGGPSAFFGPRLQSVTGNPNNLGRLMMLTGVLGFGFTFQDAIREHPIRRGGYASIFVLSTIILMFTRSRDDIVFLGVAIAILIIIQRRKLPFLFGLGVFALGFALNFDQITGTFQILIKHGNPRFGIWLNGIQFYGLELLTGVGRIDNQFTINNPFDSTYFRILLQVGIVGLVLFVLVNIRIVLGLVARIGASREGHLDVILVFLLTLLGSFAFSVDLLVFPFSLYYWFTVVLALRAINDTNVVEKYST